MSEENAVAVAPLAYDIKESSELLTFVLHLCRAIAQSLANGKVEMTDAIHFWKPASEAPAAFEGIANIPSEMGDLSGEELDQLKAILITEFPIDLPGAEKIINIAFNVGNGVLEIVQWFKAKKA